MIIQATDATLFFLKMVFWHFFQWRISLCENNRIFRLFCRSAFLVNASINEIMSCQHRNRKEVKFASKSNGKRIHTTSSWLIYAQHFNFFFHVRVSFIRLLTTASRDFYGKPYDIRNIRQNAKKLQMKWSINSIIIIFAHVPLCACAFLILG